MRFSNTHVFAFYLTSFLKYTPRGRIAIPEEMYNFDLLDRQDMMNMTNLYKALPKLEKFEEMLEDAEDDTHKQHIIRLFRCFQDKEALSRFKYHPYESAKAFLEARI